MVRTSKHMRVPLFFTSELEMIKRQNKGYTTKDAFKEILEDSHLGKKIKKKKDNIFDKYLDLGI